jgi:hypothetical protein
MDRRLRRYGSLVCFLSLAATVCGASSGCVNALAAALYVIRGDNAPAEYEGLKGQRVAVVCRPSPSLAFSEANAPRLLAAEVGRRLQDNVSKIEVIDQQEVAEWTDENSWNDFAEIGRALKADKVVGIDLEDFSLLQGQTLYQGKANVRIRVYDMTENENVAFEKIPPQSVFPPNTGIATQEKQLNEFLQQYVEVLGEEIACLFYPHDARATFAQDSLALE